MDTRKYSELKENENIAYEGLWDTAKHNIHREIYNPNTYFRNKDLKCSVIMKQN